MPRKVPVEAYRPSELPDTLPHLITHLYDELTRISAALVEFPVALNVREDQPGVPVSPIPTEFRLFEGVDPTLDLPGGDWNSATGEWYCPSSGLYQINLTAVATGPGTGNKDWIVKVHLYINDVEIWVVTDSGNDAFPLTCILAASGFIERESLLRATIELEHEQFTGTTDVDAFLNITQIAAE